MKTGDPIDIDEFSEIGKKAFEEWESKIEKPGVSGINGMNYKFTPLKNGGWQAEKRGGNGPDFYWDPVYGEWGDAP